MKTEPSRRFLGIWQTRFETDRLGATCFVLWSIFTFLCKGLTGGEVALGFFFPSGWKVVRDRGLASDVTDITTFTTLHALNRIFCCCSDETAVNSKMTRWSWAGILSGSAVHTCEHQRFRCTSVIKRCLLSSCRNLQEETISLVRVRKVTQALLYSQTRRKHYFPPHPRPAKHVQVCLTTGVQTASRRHRLFNPQSPPSLSVASWVPSTTVRIPSDRTQAATERQRMARRKWRAAGMPWSSASPTSTLSFTCTRTPA